jgi:hypothetical protein
MALTCWSITFRSLSEEGRRYGEGYGSPNGGD